MKIDYDQNEVRIESEGSVYNLHPLWIRERSNEENMVDQNSLQRQNSSFLSDGHISSTRWLQRVRP